MKQLHIHLREAVVQQYKNWERAAEVAYKIKYFSAFDMKLKGYAFLLLYIWKCCIRLKILEDHWKLGDTEFHLVLAVGFQGFLSENTSK